MCPTSPNATNQPTWFLIHAVIFQPSHFDDTIALLCAQCVCAHIHFFFHHLQILVRKNKKRSTICEIHWLISIICDTRLGLWHFFADCPENHKFHCSFIDIPRYFMHGTSISLFVYRNFHFFYIKVAGKFYFHSNYLLIRISLWILIVLVVHLIHICIFLWLSERRDKSRCSRFLGKLKNLET